MEVVVTRRNPIESPTATKRKASEKDVGFLMLTVRKEKGYKGVAKGGYQPKPDRIGNEI